MRILMIGLGSIASKAYLPVLASRAGIELHLVTRNQAVLKDMGAAYRIPHLYADLDYALRTGPFDAAFVHTATVAHAPIVERLLRRETAVLVDKPLAYRLEDVERLVEAADRGGRPLMVGFNRRYAPDYVALRGMPHDTLLMSKHRSQPPGDPRETVFDDFVHVVDTLRFLSPASDPQVTIETTMSEGKLSSILLLLSSPTQKAIGMMNRSAGLDEERLEIVGGGGRRAVLNLSETINYAGAESRTRRGDWTSVTHQRGFETLCSDFLAAVREERPAQSRDILETHRICEQIARHAEANATQSRP